MKTLKLTDKQVIDILSLVEEEIRYLKEEAIPSCDNEEENIADSNRESLIDSLNGMEDIKRQLTE